MSWLGVLTTGLLVTGGYLCCALGGEIPGDEHDHGKAEPSPAGATQENNGMDVYLVLGDQFTVPLSLPLSVPGTGQTPGLATSAANQDPPVAEAAVVATNTLPLERCQVMDETHAWQPAVFAVESTDPSTGTKNAGTKNPLHSFAQTLLTALPPERSLGLIVVPGHGAPLEEWHGEGPWFRKVRAALKHCGQGCVIKGILWYHSGNCQLRVAHLDPLKDLFSYLRVTTEIFTLPVVVCETQVIAMQSQLAALAARDPGVAVVPLPPTTLADGSVPPPEYFGNQMATQMLRLQAKVAADTPSRTVPQGPVIDAHIHAFANQENGLDLLAAWMEKNGVARCIVHPLDVNRTKTPAERALLLANYAKYKGKIDRFCIIEPGEVNTVAEAVAILEAEKAAGAIGFGEHYGVNLMFDDPKNMLLYAACEQVGLPVMFHIDANKNVDVAGLPHLENALKTYPKCTFIAHAYWWLSFADGTCDRLLQKYPQLYADVSGPLYVPAVFLRDPTYTQEFFQRNQDKILFGSDAGWWSFRDGPAVEVHFRMFEYLRLSDEIKTKLYRTNAERLFGFPPTTPITVSPERGGSVSP